MSKQENSLNAGLQVGDYTVGELLARGTNTQLWQATQQSVQREVILSSANVCLANDKNLRASFINDVRTKASLDHPLIGSVLEAVNDEKYCFFAMEKLNGLTLSNFCDEGKRISPVHVVRVLRNIASACKYLEDRDIRSRPISQHDIFIDDLFHCRIANMAVSGKIDHNVSTQDKQLIGQLFHDIIEHGKPGSTRTVSLLNYMRDLGRSLPLSWQKIHDLADEVERQLTQPSVSKSIQSPTMPMSRVANRSLTNKTLIATTVITAITGLVYFFTNTKTNSTARALPNMVLIPAGKYAGPNGFNIRLRPYSIDAHEVTINQYAKFLDALSLLNEENKNVFQHEDQPAEKISHEPDDWPALHSAAKEGRLWKNLKIDLNYPIVGVDWWDAYAYAEWMGRRLPTREEWYAACTSSDDPEELKPSGWLPVDRAEKTKKGIYGLAGNVSEWTRKRSLNSADPSQPARYVICGASYLKPHYGVRAIEWVDDRSLRRSDLGFRTLGSTP